MKREETERLLADYTSGEIAPADMQVLEACFVQDPALKKEAEEMRAVWNMIGNEAESKPMSDTMDTQFFAMLQNEKLATPSKTAKVVQINTNWLKAVAAVAACILAFVGGRFTGMPAPVVEYKTVYVKQPATTIPQPIQQVQVVKQQPTPEKVVAKAPQQQPVKKDSVIDNSALALELRSVYASERIGAVMKMTGKGNLTDADLRRLGLALREDPSPNVRLTILDALRPLASRANVQAVLISLLSHQNDELIKSSIVDLLIDTKSRQAIPQMIALLDDKTTNPGMQNKIKAGIESFLN
ncbi:HEAT repeat domain-containing protein [Mucilaginibacter sp. HMF5004]|uniref:HEAT repeat domain-containing protein n=1 Tax=Mucilaginibacter rivuli TaxID=2857527 RepID=UPI001C601E30|nr:HEAT repeat domain-containing protein [Mucilaginibacter rivuli]MBW4891717.1 HEAT repeat domain-containing protein [Mucilaginibacter rivuli]